MDRTWAPHDQVLWRCLEAIPADPEIQAATMESLTLGAQHSRQARSMLWAIFSVLRPSYIVETGTSHGLTAAFLWALGEALGKPPTVLTFDIAASTLSPILWHRLGATKFITFVQGDSATTISRTCGAGIKFALVDGDHTYRGAECDWQAIRPLLEHRSVVYFDNMLHIDGCGRFVNGLNPLWFHPKMAMVVRGLSETELQAIFTTYIRLELPPWWEAIPGDCGSQIRGHLRDLGRCLQPPRPGLGPKQVADLCREISTLARQTRFLRGSELLRVSARYNIGSVAGARRQRIIEVIPRRLLPWMMRGYRFVKRSLWGR
jgi:predicted O-methyltransferase YrrM